MYDEEKTEAQLIKELKALRQHNRELGEALRLNAAAAANMTEGVNLVRDRDSVLVYTNSAFDKMFGYEEGELAGKHVSILNAPDDKSPEDRANEMLRALQKTEQWDGELKNIKKDGSVFWSYARVTRFEHPLYGTTWMTIQEEITWRKQAEEDVRLFKAIVEHSHEAIAISDPQGQFVYVNPTHEHLFGHSLEDAKQSNYRDYYPPESVEVLNREVIPALERGESWEGELEVYDVHGRRFPLWERADTIRDANGNLLYAFGLMHDISDRKWMEEELRQQKRFLEGALESITHPFYVINANDHTIIMANSAAKKLRDSPRNVTCYELTHHRNTPCDDPEHLCPLTRMKETKMPLIVEHIHYDEEGNPRTVEVYAYPIVDREGNLIHMVEYTVDITERKQMEEQLKAALQEKEVLMREILHRTKNNMAVMSGLLTLQSTRIEDETILGIFQDLHNRIQALMLVQQKLYQAESLARLDLKDYLEDLAYTVFHSYQDSPGKISLTVDAESVLVSPDMAIPCGLILNELLTNAFKDAFPGDRNGEIHLALHTADESTIELQVRDDGIGLPEAFDLTQTDSLGLQLVRAFVTQLHGTLNIRREKGTEFQIRFNNMM